MERVRTGRATATTTEPAEVVSLPPVDRRTFRRLVRGLDAPSFAAFVADLWRARGWTVEHADGTIIATRMNPPDRLRIRPVTGRGRRRFERSLEEGVDVVVTTATLTEPSTGDSRTIDVADLYDLALYGVDRSDLDALFRSHFDRPLSSFGDDRSSPLTVLGGNLLGTSTNDGVRALGVTLLVVALVLAGVSGVALDGASPASAPTTRAAETPTAVSTTAAGSTPTPVPLRADVGTVTECPRPPVDADPQELRPPVIEHVSPTGLEGWRITAAATIDAFPGPNALPTPIAPEIQHVATYENPSGDTFRVVISRWRSRTDAVRVVEAAAADGPAWIVWGPYTVSVEVFDRSGTVQPDDTAGSHTRLLFSQIQHPDGGKLGDECVTALLESGPVPSSGTPTPFPDDLTDRAVDQPARPDRSD